MMRRSLLGLAIGAAAIVVTQSGCSGTDWAGAYDASYYWGSGIGDWANAGNFYSNWYLDAAISSQYGGSEGYIDLGDGDYVTWGF